MPRHRNNRTTFAPLGTVIEKVLREYRPPTDQAMLKVWDVWAEAVGPVIAANAKPVAFKGDLLLVHVCSSTWLHQLRFMEQEMIQKLNGLLGSERVGRIKLKIGAV